MAKIINIKVIGKEGTASEIIPSEDGKTFDFTIWEKDNKKTKRTIEEITREETEGKMSLGKTGGMDAFHCFYIASKYCEDFLREVKYYLICDKEESFHNCEEIIEFYK